MKRLNSSLKLSLLVAFAAALSACVHVPQSVQLEEPSSNFNQVAQQPAAFVGNQVRWGGIIARVENHEQDTLIEIVHLPLDGQTRPSATHQTGGRFIARVQQFLDPIIYAQGKEITVVGIVSEPLHGKVGEHEVNFPVVDTSGHHLWAKRKTHHHIDYYHSTWDPFWFYSRPYRWPYYRHLGYIHFTDYGWNHYNHFYYGRRAVGHSGFTRNSTSHSNEPRRAVYDDYRVGTNNQGHSSSSTQVTPPRATTGITPPRVNPPQVNNPRVTTPRVSTPRTNTRVTPPRREPRPAVRNTQPRTPKPSRVSSSRQSHREK